MIMYEYQCCTCGEILVVYQKITEEVHSTIYCPKCSCITDVVRLVGSSGFKLSGGGWADEGYSNTSTADMKSIDRIGEKNGKMAWQYI